ncbi:MAG: gluconate 2-dehydrogenase subunit 3 family protein [Terracidiphilus sp.]|jgi:gluconate 2-dehydrogenase gamma chain
MLSNWKSGTLTRRQFVAAGALGSAALAIGCKSANRGTWEYLTEQQAITLASICDQIVPADEFPSASQAGVLTYIDRQLMRHYRKHRHAYRHGLEDAETASRQRFGAELAALSSQRQFEIVSDLERQNSSFFNLVRSHTLEGYYGSPRHGGNRDAVSWRMLGLAEPPIRGRAQYDLTKGSTS